MRFFLVINSTGTLELKRCVQLKRDYCDHRRIKRFNILLWFLRLSKFLTFQVHECHQRGRTKGRTFDSHYKPFIGMVPSEEETQPSICPAGVL